MRLVTGRLKSQATQAVEWFRRIRKNRGNLWEPIPWMKHQIRAIDPAKFPGIGSELTRRG